jgi:hypothetical protein
LKINTLPPRRKTNKTGHAAIVVNLICGHTVGESQAGIWPEFGESDRDSGESSVVRRSRGITLHTGGIIYSASMLFIEMLSAKASIRAR